MRGRDAHFGLLLLTAIIEALLYIAPKLFPGSMPLFSKPNFLTLNTEARLVYGKRISLKNSDAYDLELFSACNSTNWLRIALWPTNNSIS